MLQSTDGQFQLIKLPLLLFIIDIPQLILMFVYSLIKI